MGITKTASYIQNMIEHETREHRISNTSREHERTLNPQAASKPNIRQRSELKENKL